MHQWKLAFDRFCGMKEPMMPGVLLKRSINEHDNNGHWRICFFARKTLLWKQCRAKP
jgi:hypothetical protein